MGPAGSKARQPGCPILQLSVLLPQLLVLGVAKLSFTSAMEQLCATLEEQSPLWDVLSLFSLARLLSPEEQSQKEDKCAVTGLEEQEVGWIPALAAGLRL